MSGSRSTYGMPNCTWGFRFRSKVERAGRDRFRNPRALCTASAYRLEYCDNCQTSDRGRARSSFPSRCNMRLRWNTTLGLIVLVAGTAVVTAVAAAMSTAIYGGRDNPLLGLGLVVASVGLLSWIRMAGELARRQAGGENLGRWAKVRLLLASVGFALLTVGLSGVAFLVVFGMLTEMSWDLPRVKFDGRTNLPIIIVGLIAGTLVALGVGFLVRRAYSRGRLAQKTGGGPDGAAGARRVDGVGRGDAASGRLSLSGACEARSMVPHGRRRHGGPRHHGGLCTEVAATPCGAENEMGISGLASMDASGP